MTKDRRNNECRTRRTDNLVRRRENDGQDCPSHDSNFLAGRNCVLTRASKRRAVIVAIVFLIGMTSTPGIAAENDRPRHLRETKNPLDVVALGHSFLVFRKRDSGEYGFLRSAALEPNVNGVLGLRGSSTTWVVDPPIVIPSDWERLRIGKDGTVFVAHRGQPTETQTGRFEVARFSNPNALKVTPNGVLQRTDDSGPPEIRSLCDDDDDLLLSGWRETQSQQMKRKKK